MGSYSMHSILWLCYLSVSCVAELRTLVNEYLSTFCFPTSWVFTALHGMETRSSDENSVVRPSVRLSVCLSVTRVDCDKTVERSVQIYIPYERTFILVFWELEWLVGGDPFYLKFRVNDPHWNDIADFQPIIARSASAVTASEKVQLTLIGSPLRAFQWA